MIELPEHTEDDANFMHIYAQYTYHDDAHIVGDLESLKSLRAVLDVVIEQAVDGIEEAEETADFFTADGEGYTVQVSVSTYEKLHARDMPYIFLGMHKEKYLNEQIESLQAQLTALQALERVPMTSDQIISATSRIDTQEYGWVLKIVRAVEADHGITPPESK